MKTYLVCYLIFLVGPCALAQELIFNELLLSSSDDSSAPWIELKNTSLHPVNIHGYKISFDSITMNPIPLPEAVVEVNGYQVILIKPEGNASIQPTINADTGRLSNLQKLYLYDPQAVLKDSLILVSSFKENESFGRYPETSRSYIFFPTSKVSPGAKNVYPGPWAKLTNHTDFSPRDSSPNACVVYDNKFWIFEGWEYNEGVFASRSNIWVSEDMINWKLVNDNPPYHPYSAYITYKGKMWAFDDKCWSSTDGIKWVEESGYFPGSVVSRVTVLRDTLWFAKARSIGYSVNGKDWHFKLHGTAPWSSRDWPGFKSFNNRLWYFGGGNVFSSYDHYYYNDVWVSDNGISWNLVTENAPWSGRFWFSYEVLDGKLWLFGGYSVYRQEEYGNMNGAWYTEDGLVWNRLETENVWLNRHAQLTIGTDSAIFITSGYSSGGVSRLHNDVWRLSLRQPQQFNIQNRTLTYGDRLPLEDLIQNPNPVLSIPEQSPIKISENAMEAVKAGTVSIKISLLNSNNYYSNDTILNIHVKKKDLMINAGQYSKVFAEDNPKFEPKYEGFARADVPDSVDTKPFVLTPVTKFSPVGDYVVHLEGGYDNNYNVILNDGTMTVRKGGGLALFPNPANAFVKIFSENCTDNNGIDTYFAFEIIDQAGRVVKLFKVHCRNQEPLPLDNIPSGIYVARIIYANELYLKKLIIK